MHLYGSQTRRTRSLDERGTRSANRRRGEPWTLSTFRKAPPLIGVFARALAKQQGSISKTAISAANARLGAPLAESMDLMPREVIRYLQLGAHASFADYFTLVSFP